MFLSCFLQIFKFIQKEYRKFCFAIVLQYNRGYSNFMNYIKILLTHRDCNYRSRLTFFMLTDIVEIAYISVLSVLFVESWQIVFPI